MAHIILKPDWHSPESSATSQSAYHGRRTFIKSMGMAIAGGVVIPGCTGRNASQAAGLVDGPLDTIPSNAPREGLPASRNGNFSVPERVVTDRMAASSYTNFYEFKNSGDLKEAWPLTGEYEPFPMTLKIDGLVQNEKTIDVADLIRSMELEERIYRFRCVEAWSMTIPWTGFPLRALIDQCEPLSKATHVRFTSVNRPKQMPGIGAAPWYSWPYFEGLRIDEATAELGFVATGMYGEPLPKQNGSPMRLVLPWKYGYKGPKAITRITFLDRRPSTFWNDLQPAEYGFLSNVNPFVPHPRWTQSEERFISSTDRIERVPTQLFNGYEEWVGDLYPDEPTTFTRTVR